MLSNEQVVQGACERCGAQVTKRELTQWFFKVTDYADRLLDDMEPLRDTWPARVLKIGARWAPYRTIASWYLWRSLEASP